LKYFDIDETQNDFEKNKDDISDNHEDIKNVLKNDTIVVDEVIENESFDDLSDEKIMVLAQAYDVEALEYILAKYKGLVYLKARSYFLVGADKDDIIQEGMIGLYKAIRDYKPDKLASFRGFAELCITRQIITAIKAATRQKHQPLNSYVSLNKPVYDDESERTLLDLLMANEITNPEDIVVGKEGLDSLESKMNEFLSKLEMQVLTSYVDGKSYVEIADELSRDVKSIDNALQRIKTKIEKYLEGNEE
jgi:RNA polymerase sporulation-specific sigma factor